MLKCVPWRRLLKTDLRKRYVVNLYLFSLFARLLIFVIRHYTVIKRGYHALSHFFDVSAVSLYGVAIVRTKAKET